MAARGQWPAVDDRSLLDALEQWLLPSLNGVRSLRALQQVDLFDALLRLLSWEQRRELDANLPTHYTVPTGSRLAIRYHSDQPPALSVRLQEMFGEQTSPMLAAGRVPVVLELLSPAHRPLQITGDLAAFWRGSYREVQKEMKGRYPKHPWRTILQRLCQPAGPKILLNPSPLTLQRRSLRLLTRITYLCKLIGISQLAALLQRQCLWI